MPLSYLEFLIDGMSGKYCVHLIKTSLASLKGVKFIDIDFGLKKVKIWCCPDEISLPIIAGQLMNLGYSVRRFHEQECLLEVV